MLVYLGISFVICCPAVSIPSDKGMASITRSSLNYFPPTPPRIAAWIPAPVAIASSGLIEVFGFLPLK